MAAKKFPTARLRYCIGERPAPDFPVGNVDGIRSYPIIRATSSTRSGASSKSARQDGGSISQFVSDFLFTSQPTINNLASTSFESTFVPKYLVTKLGSKETIGAYLGSPEELEPTYFAPPSSIIKAIARAEDISASDGSTPRSSLRDASEDNL